MKLILLAVFVGVAVAYDDSLYYVDEILNESAPESGLLTRLKSFLNKQVDSIESLAAKDENLKTRYNDQITALREEINSLSGKPDRAFFRKVRRNILPKLRELRQKINKALSKKSYAASDYNVRDAFVSVKQFLSTDEGINVARDYIRGLEANHPLMFMVKAFIESATNEALIEILQEVLKDINYYMIQGADIHDAFVQIENFMRTNGGLQAVKNYFQNLQTSHQIISRLRTMVISASDETIREFIDAVLPPVYYILQSESSEYARDDLLRLFKEIRAILITPEGIQVVKDYARALEVTHPVLFLVKAFITNAKDEVLLEILDEVFKGVEYVAVQYATTAERLEDLFIQVRDILKTEEGFLTLKNYIGNLKSNHPIVSRIAAFVGSSNNDTLREILNALFGDQLIYALQGLQDSL